MKLQIVDTAAVLAEFQNNAGKDQTRVVLVFGPNGHGSRIDVSSVLTTHFDPGSTYAQYGKADDILALLKQQSTTVDASQRAALIGQVLELNRVQERVIPLWLVNTVFATNSKVVKWSPLQGQAYPSNLQSVVLG